MLYLSKKKKKIKIYKTVGSKHNENELDWCKRTSKIISGK